MPTLHVGWLSSRYPKCESAGKRRAAGECKLIAALRERARVASRRSELASQQRAGAYSRREIRRRRREVLRQHWRYFAILLLIGVGTAAAAGFVLPTEVADFAVGALAVVTIWLGTTAMHWMDGMANHRLGLAGEELTADELHKLRKRGWRVVHHVMLEKGKGDVDHAVLGSGGFFALDSKYRTDWSTSRSNLDELARRSRLQAGYLQSRLQVKEPRVQPVVVLWGPRVSRCFDDVFDHDGVLFCVGRAFVKHASALDACVDQETIDRAFARLDDYVATRDIGEAREHGAPGRPIIQHVQDLLIATVLAAVTLVVVINAIRLPPVGVWAAVLAGVIATATRWVRRRFPGDDRIQRSTAAVLATSMGLGALLVVLVVIDLIW